MQHHHQHRHHSEEDDDAKSVWDDVSYRVQQNRGGGRYHINLLIYKIININKFVWAMSYNRYIYAWKTLVTNVSNNNIIFMYSQHHYGLLLLLLRSRIFRHDSYDKKKPEAP